jgi:AcrR family transcriptional regulator
MEKVRNSTVFTEQGYYLFAREGIEGIHIEKIARMLRLNKSGFYHYFGDLEVYIAELLALHIIKANHFLGDVARIKSIDPEYLNLIIKHQVAIMFHMQLLRVKDNESFYRAARLIDEKEDVLLGDLWSEYLGIPDDTEVAIRYFNIVRDMFYARMSFQNMNYSFLLKHMTAAKTLMQQLCRLENFSAR